MILTPYQKRKEIYLPTLKKVEINEYVSTKMILIIWLCIREKSKASKKLKAYLFDKRHETSKQLNKMEITGVIEKVLKLELGITKDNKRKQNFIVANNDGFEGKQIFALKYLRGKCKTLTSLTKKATR
jgi:hypothetical protein